MGKTTPTIISKISDIKSNPNNPRIIKDDKFAKLVKSIREFPEMLQIRPIVVNADMVVLGGNMRLKACKEAGLKEIPVIVASDLTDEQQREFIIKDNSGFGEWDMEMLANEWSDLPLEDWGINLVFQGDNKPEELWEGMPDFLADEPCFRKILINFDTQADVDQFIKLMNQPITDKTKSIWFPRKENDTTYKTN